MKRRKEEWDDLFERRTELLPPEKFLVEYHNLLKGLRVLDLACGDGRNTFYLAELGFQVFAVDFSQVALSKIDARNHPNIRTIPGDLSKEETIETLDSFDSIIINHFIPPREIFLHLLTKLNRGGCLIFADFREELERINLLYPFEGTSLSETEVVVDKLYSNSWGDFRGIIFKKT